MIWPCLLGSPIHRPDPSLFLLELLGDQATRPTNKLMGNPATLAMARRELEELYMGVPDESVNLTFQDLAEVTKKVVPSPERRKSISTESIPEGKSNREGQSSLNKDPSFNRGFQACKSPSSPHHHHHVDKDRTDPLRAVSHHRHHHLDRQVMGHHHGAGENFCGHASPNGSRRHSEYRHSVDSSMAYDNRSQVSMASTISPFSERGGRRRPGIPHSNICTICNTYLYIFRHRCLV